MAENPVTFRLDDLRGRRPIILVFAPSERSPAFENQVALIQDDGTARRLKAVLVLVLANGTSTADGERIDESSADELRTSFGVDEDDFLVVILGADGAERHRDDAPLQPAAIENRLSDGAVG